MSILSGYWGSRPGTNPGLLHWLVATTLLMLIIAGSFVLDTRLISQLTGFAQQVTLAIVRFFEIELIWVWNAWERTSRVNL